MPAGQVIGRVSIKVLPDTDDFRRRLKTQLDAATNGLTVKVKVDLDTKSLRDVTDALRDWQRRVNPLQIKVKPDMQAGSLTIINRRLAFATRPRTVPIIPYLNNTALGRVNKGLATTVSALSGGRVLRSFLSDLFDAFKRLDKMAPVIGAIGLAISGLAGIAITSVSNLAALSFTLAQIGATALALPGLFAGMAVGLTITLIALKDLKKVLPDVYKQFQEMAHTVTRNFWSEAAPGIRSLTTVYLPQLGAAAKDVGKFWGSLAGALAKPFKSALPSMFANLRESIGITNGYANVFAGVITKLGLTGSEYLPRMAEWFGQIATRFNNWLGQVAADGRLQQWVDNGLAALSDLGRIMGNAFGILASVGSAAAAGGGSTLGMFADTLERINKVVQGPVFQGGLAAVFDSAHDSINKIATTAGPALEKFFGTLPELLQAVLPVAGEAIGTIGQALASAFSNPAFQDGLINLFQGLTQALMAMAPAFGPIGAALGALGTSFSQLFTTLGPTIGTLLGTLANALTTLMPALNPLISVLGHALGSVVAALAPVFLVLVDAIVALLPPIVGLANTLVGALMPVFTQLAPMVGTILADGLKMLAPLFPMIGQAVAQIAPLFMQLVAALLPLVAAILPPLIAIFSALLPVIVQIAMAVLPPLIAAVVQLVAALTPVLNLIGSLVSSLLTFLAPALTWVAQLLMGMVTGLIGGFTSVFNGITQIFQGFVTMFSGGWDNFLNGLLQVGQGVWNLIKGAFNIFMNLGLLRVAKLGLTAVKGIFTGGWNAIKAVVMGVWSGLKAGLELFVGALRMRPAAALAELRALFSMAWNTIKTGVITAFNFITRTVPQKIGEVIGFVRGIPSRATSALGSLGSTLASAGRSLIQGFIDGIRGAIGGVRTTLQDLTHRLTDWKGPESLDRVLLVEAGQLIIDGLINGLESRYGAVRSSLQGLTSDIASTQFQPVSIPSVSGSLNALDPAMANGPGAGGVIDVDINTTSNADPEEIADELLFALRRVRSGGKYL